MATNREKNQAYDQRQQNARRPVQPIYEFAVLEAVMRSWAKLRAKKAASLS